MALAQPIPILVGGFVSKGSENKQKICRDILPSTFQVYCIVVSG